MKLLNQLSVILSAKRNQRVKVTTVSLVDPSPLRDGFFVQPAPPHLAPATFLTLTYVFFSESCLLILQGERDTWRTGSVKCTSAVVTQWNRYELSLLSSNDVWITCKRRKSFCVLTERIILWHLSVFHLILDTNVIEKHPGDRCLYSLFNWRVELF